MTSLTDLLQQGASNAWLFIPTAILLGALHGLEPGHSKTMMAAFIIAIRGTVTQAVLLGLSATISHTAIVWLVALGGLALGQNMDLEANEPYFQLASAAIMIVIASWMARRTWREHHPPGLVTTDHHHAHGDETRRVDTGHGVVVLDIFEQGVPPRWRLKVERGRAWGPDEVVVETERADGRRQSFAMAAHEDFLVSREPIPEPHEFMARLKLGHDGHTHDYDLAFVEHDHGHDHLHEEVHGLDVAAGGIDDAHALAHANDIRHRFADRKVTTGQIVLFGLTGGLIPCPAAITVLLLCLQLKRIALGATLVLSFSVGLALTMVAAGVIAALSVRHLEQRWSGFGQIVRKAPYASSAIIVAIALYVGVSAFMTLAASTKA